MDFSSEDKSLIELGKLLLKSGYAFKTVTPATHKRVLRRDEELKDKYPQNASDALRDLFGWSKWTSVKVLPKEVLNILEDAKLVDYDRGDAKSKVRFSTIDDLIFMHSGFPTRDEDSVFFGPDSYRFVRLLKQEVHSAKKVIDLGAGAGVGGLCIADFIRKETGTIPEVVLADINPQALRFSRINVAINGFTKVEVVESDILKSCPTGADVIVTNPPFVIDASERTYRHGGDNFGSELSSEIVRQSLQYLNGRGQLVIYTGSCFVKGEDQFLKSVTPHLKGIKYDYFEVDPDIFGEQLNMPEYADVERTAAIGLNINFSGK